MSEFLLFFNHGLRYVLNWKTYDMVLFLILIGAAYNVSSWKKLLILVSLFTLGHFISTFLGTHNFVSVSRSMVLFLIPLTLMIGAIFNLFTAGKEKRFEKGGVFYVVATFFGLLQGLAFAPTFNSINLKRNFLPLLELEAGIEAGQIVVVLIVLIIGYIFQSIFRFNKRDWVLVISSIVVGILIPRLIDHWIF